ncbi:MAG TPA: hypothetical protein PLX50_06445 [Candidatus Aminicenantes bacterium]|nr:hypothetical protein [Candidatus Aminicenantes bacterium]
MSESLAEIFTRENDIESFRKAVLSLDGEFPFDGPSMIALGEAYFARFPEKFRGRDMEEIRLGYAVTRICIVESIIKEMDRGRRAVYREMLHDAGRVAPLIEALSSSAGVGTLHEDCRILSEALARTKETIDEIPKGMVKERFIGGISNLHNILYLFKMTIGRLSAG